MVGVVARSVHDTTRYEADGGEFYANGALGFYGVGLKDAVAALGSHRNITTKVADEDRVHEVAWNKVCGRVVGHREQGWLPAHDGRGALDAGPACCVQGSQWQRLRPPVSSVASSGLLVWQHNVLA